MQVLAQSAAIFLVIGLVLCSQRTAGQTNACDFCDGPYKIVSPNGGETFHVGDTITIRWETDPAKQVNDAVISISLDSGKTLYRISGDLAVKSSSPLWETFPWKIPESVSGKIVVSTGVLIHVAPYIGSGYDISDNVFSITPASAKTTKPSGPRSPKTGMMARNPGETVNRYSLNGRAYSRYSAAGKHLKAFAALMSKRAQNGGR